MQSITYDEDKVLIQYVWNNCRHLMNELELRAEGVAIRREKASALESQGQMKLAAKMKDSSWCHADLAVEALLANGVTTFRQNVARRLLADPRCQELINRCPKCQRVVRTPEAMQCLWCKHDWHDEV